MNGRNSIAIPLLILLAATICCPTTLAYDNEIRKLINEANLTKEIVLNLRKEFVAKGAPSVSSYLKEADDFIEKANRSLQLSKRCYEEGERAKALSYVKEAMSLYSKALEYMVKAAEKVGIKMSYVRWSVGTREDLKVAYEVARRYLNKLKAIYEAVKRGRSLSPRLTSAIDEIMSGVTSLLDSGLESLQEGDLEGARAIINLVYDMLPLIYGMITKPR